MPAPMRQRLTREMGFIPQASFGRTSENFVADRSCNFSKKTFAEKKPALQSICAVFQELCDDGDCVFGHGVTKEQAKVLAALAKPVQIRKGEVLCDEGEPVSNFVVVINGEFTEHVVASEVKIRGRGSVIGEIGLLDGLNKGHATVGFIQ